MMASLSKLKAVENLPADAEEIVTRLSNELMQARDELAEVKTHWLNPAGADEFSSPADAIEQMIKRLVHLESSQALQAERQLRHEAEHELVMAEDLLKVVRRRAVALAALVTPELAELLERLAYGIGNIATDEGAIEAFALAARIREALEDTE